MNIHVLRKILWAPVAIASVSVTLYLAKLWYNTNMLSKAEELPPQQEESKKQEESNSSPAKAHQEGKDHESKKEGEKSTQDSKSPEQTQPVTPPSPPKTEESKPLLPEEGSQTSSSEENSSSHAVPGTVELPEYIKVKVNDLNAHGMEWNQTYNTLTSSWKLTKTINDLKDGVEELEKQIKLLSAKPA